MGSLIVHALGIVALFAAHSYAVNHKPPRARVMTITLGGSNGPRSTGMTAASARPVDQVAPQPKHEPIRTASSSKPDVMTLPIKSEPKKTPETVDRTLPVTSVAKPPTIGQQIQKGTSLAETGSTSQDKGLTVGGGAGSTATLDVAEFCCPDYLQSVVQRIELKWRKELPGRGQATIGFQIEKDGRITHIVVEKSTGTLYENNSLSALTQAVLEPLPRQFTGDHLTIHLTFPYGMK
jgi:outer membrane biosynthesis protein TonB